MQRKKWSKKDKNKIWDEYIARLKLLFQGIGEKWKLNIEAPCLWRCLKMVKGAYQGEQPTSNFAWNVDHIDSNPQNNDWKNLQPMHIQCNRRKN